MLSHPHFERSISLNDLDSAVQVREHVQQDIVTPEDDQKHSYLETCGSYTFVLESFAGLAVDFKKFLYSYLIDFVVYRELEECQRLNWCEGVFQMVPVITMGDGNCLMHAASIGMWAVSDRYHTLRKLVYDALIEDVQRFYHKRWQREHKINNLSSHSYEMTENQWMEEWQIVLDLVSQDEYPQGNNGLQYSSLEEIHIFVLANILRRTIIVISDDVQKGNYGEPLSPLYYAGVYLPLRWDPIDCVKTPLIIGYTGGHFSAIVSFEDGVFDRGEAMDGFGDQERIHGVPLQDCNGKPLPVHFLFEDEEELKDGLLRQYLDCKKIKHRNPRDNSDVVTLAAKLQFVEPPPCIKELLQSFFVSAEETYKLMLQQKEESHSIQTPLLKLEQCKTEGCEFFGTWETLNYCSKCLEEYLKKGLVGEKASVRVDDKEREKQQQQLLQLEQQQQHGHQPQVQSKPLYELQRERQQLEHRQQHEIDQFEQQQLQRVEEQPQLKHQQQQHELNRQQQQQQLTQQQHQQVQQQQLLAQSQPIQKKCANHGCKNVAEPDHADLCARCYESVLLAERQTSSMLATGSNDATLCTNNGCEYHGMPQQEGFCSRCYRRFCLEMQSLKNEESRQSVAPVNQEQTLQGNVCQTPGCTKPGCPELYNKCVECYSDCIKQFIQANEGQSLHAIILPSNPPQSASPIRACPTTGCQNEGNAQLGGLCLNCYQYQRMDIEQPPNTTTQNNPPLEPPSQEPHLERPSEITRPTPMSITEPLLGQAQGLNSHHEPSAGQEPTASLKQLYCATPKCGRPLGDTSSSICTECIMKKFQMKRKVSPQQQQPILPKMSRPSNEEETRKSERTKEIQQAREQLPPLFIPSHGNTKPLSKVEGHVTLMANNPPGNTNIQGHPSLQSATPRVGTAAETPVSKTKCLTNNCPFYASPTTQFLCSNCYDKEKREWDRINQMAQRHRPPPRKLEICALTNCYNYESPGKEGLCDKCFQTALRNEKVWDSELRRQTPREPQRQQPINPAPAAPPSPPTTQSPRRRAGNFVEAGIPCKSSGCVRFGVAETNGLCYPCFNKKQKHQAFQTSTITSVAAPANIDRERLIQRQQVPGTGFLNTSAAAPAITKRERLNQKQHPLGTSSSTATAAPVNHGRERSSPIQRTLIAHEPVTVVEPQRRVFGVGSGPRANECIQDGCKMTGSDQLGGYCSKCFEDYTKRDAYPESLPDLPMNQATQEPGQSEPVRTGLTTLPSPTPRICSTLGCYNQVQKSTITHCTECLRKLYPVFAQTNNMI